MVKFGSNLRSPDGSVELFIPNTFKAIKEFSNYNVSNIDSIIFLGIGTINLRRVIY